MGKQGPCYHCGVSSTPLWRNGPPEKPVLCNACGSRWRTKGSLTNYTPLRARAEPDDYEDHKFSRLKNISVNKNKEVKILKRKQNHDNVAGVGVSSDYNQEFRKFVDEDASNRSSAGSAISISESCAQFSSADASDLTGPAQSAVWDSVLPARKKTFVSVPDESSVEKLTKDLYAVLCEQQSSNFTRTVNEDLIFESETPMVSVEIGHGSVLIRHPSSIGREEESEASSLSVENKKYPVNEAYSRCMTLSVHDDKKGVKFPSLGINRFKNPAAAGMQQVQIKRDKSLQEKFQILGHHYSPLSHVDLNDVVNFEEFAKHLTDEEQQRLVLKYLPSIDTTTLPDSLKSMFDSSQFKENTSSFQKLLAEGVFDISDTRVETEHCKILKRLVLCNPTKSKWVECYHHLLEKCKSSIGRSHVTGEPNSTALNNLVNGKRSREGQKQQFPEAKISMKSPKRVIMKATYEQKELFDLPLDGSSLVLDPSYFVDESCDQDLLLEVPSNSSFPQAELLYPTSSTNMS